LSKLTRLASGERKRHLHSILETGKLCNVAEARGSWSLALNLKLKPRAELLFLKMKAEAAAASVVTGGRHPPLPAPGTPHYPGSNFLPSGGSLWDFHMEST
jgi:hypothetical protein